ARLCALFRVIVRRGCMDLGEGVGRPFAPNGRQPAGLGAGGIAVAMFAMMPAPPPPLMGQGRAIGGWLMVLGGGGTVGRQVGMIVASATKQDVTAAPLAQEDSP